MKIVLFACVHNAGRSQMAAGFFNQLADRELACAVSAGTQPGEQVHPVVRDAMLEVGIDLGSVRPRLLSPELAATASWLITMGCGDACPVVAGAQRADWPLEDPNGKALASVRAIRDQVRARVLDFALQQGWLRARVPHDQARPILAATEADHAGILRLLKQAALPVAGIEDQFPAAYWVVPGEGEPCAVVGLERYGRYGLLRSLAVEPATRSRGVGSALTRHVQRLATERGLWAVYLLTNTAADFFARRGFEVIVRSHAPAELQAAPEFASICPDTATCLRWSDARR